MRELVRSLPSANPSSSGAFKSYGTTTRTPIDSGWVIIGCGKAKICYFGSITLEPK